MSNSAQPPEWFSKFFKESGLQEIFERPLNDPRVSIDAIYTAMSKMSDYVPKADQNFSAAESNLHAGILRDAGWRASLHPLSNKYLDQVYEALNDFGSYTFSDKGPQEVMDTALIEEELRKLEAMEAAVILNELYDANEYTAMLVEYLFDALDDWDELMVLDNIQDLIV